MKVGEPGSAEVESGLIDVTGGLPRRTGAVRQESGRGLTRKI